MNNFTKIVATIGPISRNEETIYQIIKEGVDVIRLNFSHGNWEDHLLSVKFVRKASEELNKPVAIFQDLQGPKIRVGQLRTDFIELKKDENLILTTENIIGGEIDGIKKISIDYKNLNKEAKENDRILIDDGLIELRVQEIKGNDIITKVINGGILKPRKGVNLPNTKLNISAVTDKDEKDLEFAYNNNLDFVALSFVRSEEDIKQLIDIMIKKYGRRIPIIAKIEKPEAYKNIDNIIDIADIIMVARGDLGVETSPQDVPIIQKDIIKKCNLCAKPVITATQMLESMINNPFPTRAEANDIANSILDGTDAVMLSGETAAGKYPVEAVKMMRTIATKIENSSLFKSNYLYNNLFYDKIKYESHNIDDALGFAVIEIAERVKAKYIVTFTHSGGTARKISKYRKPIPIIAFTPIKETVKKLSILWGTIPIEIGMVKTVDELLEGASEVLKFKGLVSEGDIIVITAGVPVGVPGSTNMIKVVKI